MKCNGRPGGARQRSASDATKILFSLLDERAIWHGVDEMAKRAQSRAIPSANPESDPLADSIGQLTLELRVLRETIDQLREDFSWVTRNGLPIQPIEHVIVKRMARDPCADDWNDKLELCRMEMPDRSPDPTLDLNVLDRIVESLTTTVETVAQGQLEAMLSAIDVVRNQILEAFDQKSPVPQDPATVMAPSTPAIQSPSEKPLPGRLF